MTTPKRGVGWFVWFCLALALGVVAVIGVGMLKQRDRLTPEALAAARQRWDEKGPADYTLTYTIQRGGSSSVDRYVVKVRNKHAVDATVNGQEDVERLPYYGMHKLFDFIVAFQKIDTEKSGKRFFSGATFDSFTGALKWYARRELGGEERVEIVVESLEPENP
jgi:hypothetical protein